MQWDANQRGGGYTNAQICYHYITAMHFKTVFLCKHPRHSNQSVCHEKQEG